MMRDYLDYECQFWPGGWRCTFNFCDYDPETCPFGDKFCRCKDYLSEYPSVDDDQAFTHDIINN